MLARPLRKASTSAIPDTDQIGHYFGGPHWTLASAPRTQYFQRFSHYLRFGAAGLTRNVLKKAAISGSTLMLSSVMVKLYHNL